MTTDVVNRSDHSLSFSDTSYCRDREGCLRRLVSPSVAAVEISRICLACALYVAYVCHLTCVQDKDRARIRDNQRRLRAKRKEHQKKLEQQLSLYHRQGIAASTEIQMAARKVADENKMLRTLLNKLGVNNNNIEVYLQSSADTTADTLSGAPLTDPSAVETLETLLEPRRPRSLDPDAAFCLESRRPSGNGSTEAGQDSSRTCIAVPRAPWDAPPAVQTGGVACRPGNTLVASTDRAEVTMLAANLALPSLPRDPAGLQAFVFDTAGQPLQGTSALGISTTQHAPMQCAPTTVQPPASLLRATAIPLSQPWQQQQTFWAVPLEGWALGFPL